MKRIAPIFFLLASAAFGVTEAVPMDPSDDFSPMLFMIAMMALAIFIILIGVGIVIAVIAAGFCLILISLGILSTAALTGILRRKFSSGLRALHYQVCAAAALPAGVAGFWGISYLFGSEMPFPAILIIGSASGICAGLVIAFVLDHAAGIAYRYYTKSKTPPQTPAIGQ